MANDVTTTGGNQVAVTGVDAFAQYAEATNTNKIIGDLLKFNKGDWLAGQDEREIKAGTRLVADMSTLWAGWVRWEGGKPTDQKGGMVIDGHVPAVRRSLGDLDESEWETDDKGQPKDPWQNTNYLILKEEDGDQLYTLALSSKGGTGAVSKMCQAYSKGARMNGGKFPVLAMNVDKYKHKNPEYGWIKVPKLDIVGWVDPASFGEALAAAEAAENADDDTEKVVEGEQEEKKTKSGKTRF